MYSALRCTSLPMAMAPMIRPITASTRVNSISVKPDWAPRRALKEGVMAWFPKSEE
ncbi:hypothetical protein D9M68_873630 [compost metagenome]